MLHPFEDACCYKTISSCLWSSVGILIYYFKNHQYQRNNSYSIYHHCKWIALRCAFWWQYLYISNNKQVRWFGIAIVDEGGNRLNPVFMRIILWAELPLDKHLKLSVTIWSQSLSPTISIYPERTTAYFCSHYSFPIFQSSSEVLLSNLIGWIFGAPSGNSTSSSGFTAWGCLIFSFMMVSFLV